MNKKLIAAAVSAAVVAPVASQADVSVYGRINNAISIDDRLDTDDAESTTDVSDVASRFGARASSDLGNGLTAHGQYEFATNTDNSDEGITGTRIATVGLSGAFGRIDVGNQWSSYFNTVGTLISPSFSLGGYVYSSVGGGIFRTSNTIKYSNNFGPLAAQLDLRLNDSNDGAGGDGVGLGLSFAVTDNISIAAAFDSTNGTDRPAVTAVAGRNALVTSDYDPGNQERRGSVTVDVLNSDSSAANAANGDAATATPRTFVAVITADQGGGYVVPDPNTGAKDSNTHVSTITYTGLEQADGTDVANTAAAATLQERSERGRVISERVAPVGAQVADTAPDTDLIGFAVNATFGDFWVTAGWQNISVDADSRLDTSGKPMSAERDTDTTFLYGGGSIGEKTSWLLGVSAGEIDDVAAVDDVDPRNGMNDDGMINRNDGSLSTAAVDGESTQTTWGVYHNLGGGLRLYYEGTSIESESREDDGKSAPFDGAKHLFGMRFDF